MNAWRRATLSLRQIVVGSLLLLLAMLAVVAEAGLVATVVPPGSVLAMPTPEAVEQTEVAYIAERTAMTDVCSGPSFQRDVCADLATRVALAPTQVVARGTN